MENTYPIYIQLRQTLSGAHPTWHKASPQFYWPGCHWDNLGAVYRLVTQGAMGRILSCFFTWKYCSLKTLMIFIHTYQPDSWKCKWNQHFLNSLTIKSEPPLFFIHTMDSKARPLKWLEFNSMGLTVKDIMHGPLQECSTVQIPSLRHSASCTQPAWLRKHYCALGLGAALSIHCSFVWYHIETVGWVLLYKSLQYNK